MAPSQVELGYWAFKCLKCLYRTPDDVPHHGIAQDKLDLHYQQVHISDTTYSGTLVDGYWEHRKEEYANHPYQGVLRQGNSPTTLLSAKNWTVRRRQGNPPARECL